MIQVMRLKATVAFGQIWQMTLLTSILLAACADPSGPTYDEVDQERKQENESMLCSEAAGMSQPQ